jgi:hypothetical protein
MGLAVGKVSHAIAASATPRLNALEPLPASAKATQVALNDVERTVTSGKRTDHVAVEDLLTRANMMSFNRLAAVAAATETWKSFHSTDGEDGGRNLIGKTLFDQVQRGGARTLRSEAAGEVRVPLQGCKTLLKTAANIWNSAPELRSATTLTAAKRASKSFAATIPI